MQPKKPGVLRRLVQALLAIIFLFAGMRYRRSLTSFVSWSHW